MSGSTGYSMVGILVRPLALFAASVSLGAVQPGSRPEARLEQSSAKLAAALSIERLAGRIASEPIGDGPLFDAMLGEPERFRGRDAAERELRARFAEHVANVFSSEASKILGHLAGERPVGEVFDGDFMSARTNPPPGFVEGIVAGKYKPLFDSARARAVKSQAGRISAKTRPTVEEVDSLDEGRLAELLAERVANEQPDGVFEENLKFIRSEIVRPMIDEAISQRGWQRGIALSCQADGSAPSTVASNIARRVEEAIQVRRSEADTADQTYGIFPSILGRTIPEAASARVSSALDRIMDEMAVPLDANAIAVAIAEDIERHHSFAESRKAFLPGLSERMKEGAVAAAVAAAPESERAELREFAQRHFNGKVASERLARRVSHELDSNLRELREAFAGVQFEKTFPALAGKTWAPDEALVEIVALSNDFRKVLSRWRKVGGLDEIAAAAEAAPLLEECERQLDKSIVERFEPGVASLARQSAIIDALYPKIRDEFAGRQVGLDAVVSRFTALVAERWGADRLEVLSRQDSEAGLYQSIFPGMARKIELLSRAIMEAQEEKEKPQEKPEEDTPPPPEELEEVELSFAIRFDRRHDEIVSEISFAGESLGGSSCPYPPSSYRRNAGGFADRTVEYIGNVLRETARKNRIRLAVSCNVQDPLVYYGAVENVKIRLRSIVEEIGEYVTSFEFTELQE